MSGTDYFFEKTSLSWKQNSRRRKDRNWHGRNCLFRIPWFLKDIADRVTKAMCLRSVRRSSIRVSSSKGRLTSNPIGAPVDYHRTAAVEDCIEFIHSSFSRSNSLTTTSPGGEFMHTSLRNFEL